MVRRCATIRYGVLLCLLAVLTTAGCGGDADTGVTFPPPPPPAGAEIRGTVLMPNGRVAQAPPSPLEQLASLIVQEVRALTSDIVEAVGRNQRVTLSFRRNDGILEDDLGEVFTDDTGSYMDLFIPDGLTIDGPGGRFIVYVGSGDSLTRAFVCSSVDTTDIWFNSEAAVRLILREVAQNPLVRLEDFSALEICQIVQAIEELPGDVPGNNAAEVNAFATQIAGDDARIQDMIQAAGGNQPTPTPRTPSPTSTNTGVQPPTATPTQAPPTVAPTNTQVPPTGAPTATFTSTPMGVQVNVGVGAVNGSNQIAINVNLVTGGDEVGGVQNDIIYDVRAITLAQPSRCTINAAIGGFPLGFPPAVTCGEDVSIGPCKTLNRVLNNCGENPTPQGCPSADPNLARFRAIIAATATPNDNPIPDAVLYTCIFDVVSAAQLPSALDNMNVVASDPLGNRVEPVLAGDGLATIGATVTQAATAGSTSLVLDNAASFPASGFILINNQLIAYTKSGNTLNLEDPLDGNASPGQTVFLAEAPVIEPTNTPVQPTSTPVTPTNTVPPPPTDTPTNTPVTPPPSPTDTAPQPTDTPTNTPVTPPSNTPVTPTSTMPPPNTPVPTSTPVPPTDTPTNTPVTPTGPTPNIDVGNASGMAGQTVQIAVTLSGGNNQLTATSNDIVYDTSQVRVALNGIDPACTISAAIGGGTTPNKMLLLSRSAAGGSMELLRVGVISFQNSNSIPDGALFTCTFQIDAAATAGAKVLVNTPSGSDALGEEAPVGGADGTITVEAAGGASIDVGNASGAAGAVVPITVTLNGGNNGLTATSNDIVYDTSQVRVALNGIDPACTISSAIGSGTTPNKMLLLSRSSAGGSMELLRVGVISFQNSNSIPDGALFTCNFQIDAAATAGDKTLANTASGSDALGEEVAVGGADGIISVESAPTGPAINVGNASGAAGAVVPITVTLSGGNNGLTATSNDIVYDTSQVRVALNGIDPACTISAAIGGGTTPNKMLLLSRSDAGGGMERLRVGVISFQNSNSIPDGPLFSCNFQIAPAATAGAKTLANSASGSDALGEEVSVGGANGTINVGG